MMTREEIEQWYPEQGIILHDGLDEALIGVTENGSVACACYGYERIMNILCRRDGMTWEEAVEYIEYNYNNAYIGDGTPVIVSGESELQERNAE
jgi:hypothetical protein